MPTTKATVIDVADRIRSETLAVVVTPQPEKDRDGLVKLLLAAEGTNANFKAGTAITLLALGPVVDGPDRAAVCLFTRNEDRLDLRIVHTNCRYEGVTLLRNVPKQHLAQVPIESLPPGQYSLNVTWQPVKATLVGRTYRDPKSDDKALPDRTPLVQTIQFRISKK